MSKSGRTSKEKLIKPTFFVFCEGETEEQYVKYLKSKYRLPIEIVAKVAGNGISSNYIKNCKQKIFTHKKDKTFLMYDLDVPEIFDRLNAIKNTILLASNPCFEFWYLLHYQEHNSHITTQECEKKLVHHHLKYEKGKLDFTLKSKLDEKQEKAVHRAKKLSINSNPSTQIFILINELDNQKRQISL